MRFLKPSIVFCVCLITAVTIVPGHVAASGTVTIDGMTFVDSDSDHIRDYDDDTDANADGISDGNVVDNCRMAMNGNCDADPMDCDINENGTTEEIELRAGFQADWNGNGIGDACDDTDSDTIPDYRDNCKTTANTDQDLRACTDTDHDTFEDLADNCVNVYNPNQRDTDGDGFGDFCDICPYVANSDQSRLACPANNQIPGHVPAESPIHVPPNEIAVGPDLARGSGGCSIAANAASSAWMFMTLASILGLALVRTKNS